MAIEKNKTIGDSSAKKNSSSNFSTHELLGKLLVLVTPFLLVLVAGIMGDIGLSQIPSGLLEAIFRVPRHAMEYSVLALFANLSIGLTLAIGAFIIERINTLGKGAIGRYGAYTTAIILVISVVLFLSLSEAETIARLV